MVNHASVDNPREFSVSDVQLRFVEEGKDGLLAWASCVIYGTIYLNNISIRRGKDGRLMLTYPAKLTPAGTRYYLFNPISSDAAVILEAAIIGKVRELLGPGVVPVEGGKG